MPVAFVCDRKCYVDGILFEEDAPLEVEEADIKPCPECEGKTQNKPCRKCKGTGRSFPPHHFIGKDIKIKEEVEKVEGDKWEIKEMRKKLDNLGIAYDRRWAKFRLEEKLTLARRDHKEVKK